MPAGTLRDGVKCTVSTVRYSNRLSCCLYNNSLSTPSEDENRFSKILREEQRAVELSTLAEQKLHFRVNQLIETGPWDRQNFMRLFSGWWKLTNGVESFDWDTWYKQALEKYGDGGLLQLVVFSCLHDLVHN